MKTLELFGPLSIFDTNSTFISNAIIRQANPSTVCYFCKYGYSALSMIRYFLVCLFLYVLNGAAAQHPNEWINHQQDYFRISVAQDGIYRVTALQLIEAGFPSSGTDPSMIRVFHRGVEQAIHVAGESDGIFDSSDYIEFFGRKNDASLDAMLFKSGVVQHNPYHAIFSDTTSYFLTVGPVAGRRMPLLADYTPAPPIANFHIDEKRLVFGDEYARGISERDEMFSSAFETGEGWTSTAIRQGQVRDYVLSGITRTVPAAGKPTIEIMLVGRNAIAHTMTIRIGSSLRVLKEVTLEPFEPLLISEQVEWNDITVDGRLTVRFSVPNFGYNDQVSVSYLRVRYPQATDVLSLTEKLLEVPAGNSVVNLSLTNALPETRLYDITDPSNVGIVNAVSDTELKATLSDATSGVRIWATSTWRVPAKIQRVRFNEINPQAYDYIFITHPLLRKPAGEYADPVEAYAMYRESMAGGGYRPLVINIGDVFDQFNFGEKSPLAINSFLKFLSESNPPAYLFLVGKGLEYNQKYYRTANSGTWPYQDLVPTGGSPGSDVAFTIGLSGTGEGIPTGRLPAMLPSQVAAYLNKVIETESAPFDALWRKKILHLSGGIESWEPSLFKQYLQDFQKIAEAPFLGGQVEAIAKQSREIQTINIAEQVNSGLGLVTFFGHSSTSTLDFDIGYVTNKLMGYSNKGKYPMLLMNGCEVGAFFLRATLFGEDWILADQLGASGFIGHNAYASVNNLYRYSRTFYQVAYGDSVFINRGIGDIKNETGRRFLAGSEESISDRSQVEQMILLGDPAVRLFGASKPDLEVRENQVSVESFNNTSVSVSVDSFAIKFVVRNYGRVDRNPFRVEVRRTYPDNTFETYDSIYMTPLNVDTLYLVIRNTQESKSGNNHFHLTLDADDIIDELDESNNTAEITLFIPGNGTRNLYPADFAIVHEPVVRLSFQTTDLFAAERSFVLEVDTVKTFDSPFKTSYRITGEVLAVQKINLFTQDSLAYYWRTRLEEALEGEDVNWTVSSFTYISNAPDGWAQIHFPQFLDNVSKGIELDESSRRIAFQSSRTPVDIVTFGASSGKPRDSVSVRIAGQEYNLYTQGFGCRMNTINLIAFDRSSTSPYVGVYLKWYEINQQYGGRRLLCGREPFVINSFMHNEVATGKSDLLEYIDNVALGDSVVLYTMGNANFNLWPAAAIDKLGELGISQGQFSELITGEPVVIFARKGSAPGTARIFRSADDNPGTARLVVKQAVTGGYDKGSMTSPLIGPAYYWDKITFSVKDTEPTDDIRLEIRGVKLNREEVVIYDNVSDPIVLSGIDADEFPFLRIVFHTADETLLTSAQISNWMVFYSPVPEGILIPGNRSKSTVQVQEGDVYRQQFRFVNISEYAYRDSLTVQSVLSNLNSGDGNHVLTKIRQPAPGDTTHFEITRNTKGFGGSNDLHVFVNPRVLPEQIFDNNLLLLRNAVYAAIDSIPPVTEVTFDGKFIENGEYVAARPRIRISIIDENPFIFRTDTTGIRIFLTTPCGDLPCDPEYISFSRPDVRWYPQPADHKFVIEFSPTLKDGTYTLSVESADARGNKASVPFGISFVVLNKTSIAVDAPYPNPTAKGSTFAFNVSGSEVPTKVLLEVIDLSGRKVFSHQYDDAMFVGKNQVFWNGTDQSGGMLPDGLYAYRLKIFTGPLDAGKETIGKLIIRR